MQDNEAPTPQALPDKPPPKGCCSKIAAFLTVGPEVKLALDIGSTRLALSLSLGRRERERA